MQIIPALVPLLLLPALPGQQPPLSPITPLGVDPHTVAAGTTSGLSAVIDEDASGTPVSVVAQIEMRPLGTTGRYRVACSAILTTGPRPQLMTGTLDLGVTPPVWLPDDDVTGLNVPTRFNFQVSMSPDGLVVVWDIYNGATHRDYPSLPGGKHFAFVCARPSTAVRFRPVDVRAMFVGRPVVPLPWCDPRLGDAPPLASGRYELFFSDATLGGPGDILRGEVDPATGTVTASSVLLAKPAGVTYYHSPGELRDAAGRVRALACAQNLVNASNSDVLWHRNATNTGSPYMILDGGQPLPAPNPAPAPVWFSTGTTIGGSFTYGTYTSQQIDPYRVEHVLLADANVRIGETLVGWAPVRPTPGPGAPAFLSWIAVGTATAPGPIQVPSLGGLLLLDPTTVLGVLGALLHDNHTGRAELAFGSYPLPAVATTLPMQMVTLDVTGARLVLSNAANITF